MANAARLLASVTPETDERIDEELVWLRLVLMQPRPERPLARQQVRQNYQLFERDGADDPEEPAPAEDDPAMARAVASAVLN